MGADYFGNDSSKCKAQWQPAPAATRQPDQPQLKHQMSQNSSHYHGDEQLFHTPSDLVCPITLSLFSDPVCNALGQVYERSAIQRHLVQAAVNGQPPTDPISNAVLPSLDLVPVYPMKSRAAQYRESASRACVQIAAAPDCPDPVRYLRRAAELVIMAADSTSSNSGVSSGSITPTSSFSSAALLPPSSAGLAGAAATAAAPAAAKSMAISLPGMTLEFARYLAAHQGSAYDALVLKYFGNELLRAGCADAAADVFYRLLLEADDPVQQAEYLQLCLDCWTSSSSSSSEAPSGAEPAAAAAAGSTAHRSSSTTAPGTPRTSSSSSGLTAIQQQQAPEQQQHQQQQQSDPAAAAAAAAAANPHIIGRLADFVQRQRVLSPSAIVHMLQSMNHGPHMALQLCQLLLARASAAAAAAASPESEAALGLPGGMGGVLEVFTSLLDLQQTQYQQQLQGLAAQLQALEAAQRQQQSARGVVAPSAAGAANTSGSSSVGAAGEAAGAAGGGAGDKSKAAQGSRSRRKQGVSWKGGKGLDVVLGRVARVAAAGTLAAASLVGGNHPLLRVARVGPLMYLLRAGL